MLEFINIDVRVGKTTILKNQSISFDKGKITSIIGPNGCGKTTLLQTLNRQSTVTSGKIELDGQEFLKLSLRERAKRLSFMPQLRESATNISVKGLIEHGRFPYMGFSRSMNQQDRIAVSKAIEYTRLSDYTDKMVAELSGGLQQRAYLAMQLAQNSEYMVMDEPMTYLDFPGQRTMYDLISELKKDGKTLILVLHDLSRALQISDRIVVMMDREIIGSGTPEECFQDGIIQKAFECQIFKTEINGSNQFIFQ